MDKRVCSKVQLGIGSAISDAMMRRLPRRLVDLFVRSFDKRNKGTRLPRGPNKDRARGVSSTIDPAP